MKHVAVTVICDLRFSAAELLFACRSSLAAVLSEVTLAVLRGVWHRREIAAADKIR